jgi:hypothetical protein
MNAIIGAAAAVSMKAMRDREEAEEEARKPLPFLARCKQLEEIFPGPYSGSLDFSQWRQAFQAAIAAEEQRLADV